MYQMISIIFVTFIIGIAYSYIINKYSKNRFLLFAPGIFGILFHVYLATIYKPVEGLWSFADLTMIAASLMVLALMVGNIASSIFFIYKQRNNTDL